MFRTVGVRSLDAALREVQSPEPRIRVSAVRDLARHAGSAVVEALRAALGDAHAEVRAAAAMALADAGISEAVPDLIAALDDDDAQVKQMALMALGELGDAAATEPVALALDAPEAALRFQAVMTFARVCEDRARVVDALLAATEDDDPLVAHIALRMAEELGGEADAVADPKMLARARKLLAHDSDVVRLGAAVLLGRSGSREGEELLVGCVARAVRTTEADDEASAIELCGELGLSDATAALELRGFAGLLTRDPYAWHARVALAALNHERAVRWVLSELAAWTRERRSLGVAAAARARLPAARPALEAMRGQPDRADPDAVDEALAAIVARMER